MYSQDQLKSLLEKFLSLPWENEWLEFKTAENDFDFDKIWQYFSALSNEALLKNQPSGWLIFWVNDQHKCIGTNYRNQRPKLDRLKQEIAEHTGWLSFVEIHEIIYDDKRVILFEIPSAREWQVTKRKWFAYWRNGESLWALHDYELEIINKPTDRSAKIIDSTSIESLDNEAIQKARVLFYEKNKNRFSKEEMDWMDDITFLNKAKITINGKITNTAILLLWKEESSVLLSPSVAQISWILYNEKNEKIDYEHFSTPFLLSIEKVYAKIRNLNYRYLPDQTIFPTEISKYDPWVIREALNNAIAHEDYSLASRIILEEKPDDLVFSNAGSFIPWTIEKVIKDNAPEKYYRNKFLADAMVNLKMIDTIWSGIIKMFNTQKQRFFPLPDYDLTKSNSVKVTITGKILDDKYTKLLKRDGAIWLDEVVLLDKVQKKKKISIEDAKKLRKAGLVDGIYPNLFISLNVAQQVDEVAEHIKRKWIHTKKLEEMILDLIKKNKSKSTTRSEINKLLEDFLPKNSTEKQKIIRTNNIIAKMSRNKLIKNTWSDRHPIRTMCN